MWQQTAICMISNSFNVVNRIEVFLFIIIFYYFPLKLKTETTAIIKWKKNHKMLPTTANICILAFLNMINIYSFISNITKLWIHDIETQHHINTFSLCCFLFYCMVNNIRMVLFYVKNLHTLCCLIFKQYVYFFRFRMGKRKGNNNNNMAW